MLGIGSLLIGGLFLHRRSLQSPSGNMSVPETRSMSVAQIHEEARNKHLPTSQNLTAMVRGKVTYKNPNDTNALVGPLSGRPCLVYQVSVERVYEICEPVFDAFDIPTQQHGVSPLSPSSHNSSRFWRWTRKHEVVSNTRKGLAIYLHDGTGQLRVCDVSVDKLMLKSGNRFVAHDPNQPHQVCVTPDLQLLTKDFSSSFVADERSRLIGYRITEHVLPFGITAYAAGAIVTNIDTTLDAPEEEETVMRAFSFSLRPLLAQEVHKSSAEEDTWSTVNYASTVVGASLLSYYLLRRRRI